MKNTYKVGILALAIGMAGCEAVDPFETVNPNLEETDVVGKPNSSIAWLHGMDRQMAITFNQIGTLSEIGSDNYDNTETFFNQFLDGFNIQYQDNDVNVAHRGIGRLRKQVEYGFSVIGPNDPSGFSDATKAEYHFYLGIAYLYAGEYYHELPAEDKGPLVSRNANLQAAADEFTSALDLSPSHVGAMLGKARAYYRMGNKTEAVAAANDAIAADGDYVRMINFDPVNSDGTNNGFDYTKNFLQLAIQERGTFDDLQPLPRLDFLDPKLYAISGTQDSPIPLLKIEEAYLIIAEAQISDAALPLANVTLKDLVNNLVNDPLLRPLNTFNDGTEDRTQNNPGSRPDTSWVVVDGRSGLVLDRKLGPISVPAISGTSITDAEIDAATLAGGDAMLELLYLMRQEIFIAEGRRFVDMGLTYVISEQEALQNDNIGEGHSSTIADIPPFLAAIAGEADAFAYDAGTGVCTITHDVNAIIVANKASDYVCPFE